ncbi:MAG: TRAP transporter substrate-binding protein [Rhodospirillaceae bacterium]|nr:TRAP transporter substrate-binding protein [Rhodospirillaceae bacterium]
MTRHAVFAVAALALFAGTAAAEPIKLKFSAFEPPKAFGPARVYGPWAKAVNEASKGTVQVEVFAGGALGKPVAQLQIVQDRVADLSQIVPSFTPGRFQYNEIGELPFMWDDPTVAGIAVLRLIEKGLLKYPGVKVLSATMTGAYQLHTVKPVKTLADVKGLKIRAAGPIFGNIVRAIGAAPVGIPTPAVAENISRKVLDGAMNDWTLVEAFRILDVTPNHFVFPLGGVIAILGMNEKSYDALPADGKAAIDKYSGVYYAKLWGDVVKSETDRVVAGVKANPKHHIVVPDAAETARWDAALKPVVAEWAAKSPEHAKLLAAFKAELEAAKKHR